MYFRPFKAHMVYDTILLPDIRSTAKTINGELAMFKINKNQTYVILIMMHQINRTQSNICIYIF